MVLHIEDLSLAYRRREVVAPMTLAVERGESVAVVGRSGSGKSTLLSAILGMVKPVAGTLLVDGRDPSRLSRRGRADYLRTTVSMVFQHGELIDELQPIENVAVPALLAGMQREAAFVRSRELLDSMDLPSTGTTTGVLSGGERQRVAVARALITDPALVLADEPTGALDADLRTVVGQLVLDIPRTRNAALLLVTHDESLAAQADRAYRLRPQSSGGSLLEPMT